MIENPKNQIAAKNFLNTTIKLQSYFYLNLEIFIINFIININH